MKGSQVKTNATVTVQMPNIKCSILLTVATTLRGFTANVLDIRGQKYTKKTQIKNISKIQPVKNKFMMIPRMNTMCGNLVRLVKAESMKLKDTQLHLFMRENAIFDIGDSFGTIHTQSKNEIDIPCTEKARILNFSFFKFLNFNFRNWKST